MKAIVTRQNDDGSYDEVGMNNRTIVTDLKTPDGVARRLRRNGWWSSVTRRLRVEVYQGDNVYKSPDRVLFYWPELMNAQA